MKIIKALLNFLLFTTILTSAYSQITKSNVNELVEKAISEVRFAGATVLVAKGDEIIHHQAYGYAHVGLKVPASTDTKYFILGFNDTILGAIALQFVENKRMSLDDKILKYLPKLPSTYEAITIKHLLTCTSGIPDYHYLGDRYESTIGQPHHYDEVLARFEDLPLVIVPGSQFDWYISNFLILSMILEEISGKPYSELLKEYISPLKINSTAVIDYRKNIEGFAPGYLYNLEKHDFFLAYQSIFNHGANLRIHSTTGDLFEIWKGLKNNTLISKQNFELMTSKEEAKKNNSGSMGYLLNLYEYEGKTLFGFRGALPGYSSSFNYIPSDDITIIVLSNTGVSQEADRIASNIVSNIIKLPYLPRALPKSRVDESLPISIDSMKMFTGTFQVKTRLKSGKKGRPAIDTYKRTLRVFIYNNQLLVQYAGELPSPLLKQKNGSYLIQYSIPQYSLRFVFENGTVKSFIRDRQTVEEVGVRIGDDDVKTFHNALLK